MSTDRVFAALASQPRREILAYLNAGEMTAGEIAERFDFSKPTLSGHLRALEDAGLIAREKRGQFTYFSLVPGSFNTIFSWAAKVCPVAGPIMKESRAKKEKKS